jgi:carbon storage regulator
MHGSGVKPVSKIFRELIGESKSLLNMLVLSRQCNESIVIGDDLEIVVLEVLGDRVRIGVRAHADGPTERFEIGQTEPSVANNPVVNSGPDEIDDMDAHFG